MPAPANDAAELKMRAAGVAEEAIAAFALQRDQLARGATGLMGDEQIEPVGELPSLESLPTADPGRALQRAVVIRLNGGLGTSMGLSGPKSLIEARDGLSFLDLIARQTLALRRRHGVRLPLVLMDSFATGEASLRALERHPALAADVPADFLQSMQPKLRAEDLQLVDWPADPALEWCPPGHGDLYPALQGSGMLDALLQAGYEHAFVANSDNLGAVLDPRILAWLAAERIPFLMEVSRRTEADRKGGHIARRGDGRLVLRESAQVPDADAASFADSKRWSWFNTNNLWISLPALRDALAERDGVLGLPLIVNRKTVDPSDPSTPEVIQLETAMGAAIATFEGARALCVPRTRFAPVKTSDDLLALRSDLYELGEDGVVRPAGGRREADPFVDLDPRFYKLLPGFEARFPAGPPSLKACERFVVRGDVHFGARVTARGRVELEAGDEEPLRIPDGAVIGDGGGG